MNKLIQVKIKSRSLEKCQAQMANKKIAYPCCKLFGTEILSSIHNSSEEPVLLLYTISYYC